MLVIRSGYLVRATGSRLLFLGAITATAAVGLLLDPLVSGAVWWQSPDAIALAEAMAVPVGAWLVVAVGIIVGPRLLGLEPTARMRLGQGLWVAASSLVAWVPVSLLLADAFDHPSASRLAVTYSIVAFVGAVTVFVSPRSRRRSVLPGASDLG